MHVKPPIMPSGEVSAVILLTFGSIQIRAGLLKINEKKLKKNNGVQNIPLLEINDKSNVMAILQGSKKSAIKNLIMNSSDDKIKKNMRFLNMDGAGFQDLAVRRKTNKNFFQCLFKVYPHRPTALVWLKNNIEFDTCQRMLSDLNYTGSLKERMMDKIKAKKEEKEEYLANHLNFFITSGIKVSYKSLMKIKRVCLSYLDLINDSMLLITIVTITVWDSYEDSFTSFQTQVT